MRALVALTLALLVCGCACMPPKEVKTEEKKDSLVCPAPYIQVGGECCLDRDGNDVCDRDETPTTTVPEEAEQEETSTTEPAATEPTATVPEPTTTTIAAASTTTQPAVTASTLPTTTTSTTTTSTSTTTTVHLPCTDSDGGENELVKGMVRRGAETGYDSCEGTATVREFYCMPSDKISWKLIQCPKGCSDGACIGCVDTDGGDNPGTYGEAKLGTTLLKKDMCQTIGNGTTLQEYFCKSRDEIGSRIVDCPGGCSGGRCM
jgi:hypothetical protein